MIKTEHDIIKLIEQDNWMMNVLKAARQLNLPDWWVCAGFVRSKIWDTLHHFHHRTPLPDVDVIYFDETQIDELREKKLEAKLKEIMPEVPWSVKNEARMHVVNDVSPYASAVDAIAKFPDTATALGIKLDKKDKLVLTAPCGIQDVINLEVKPTPFFAENRKLHTVYHERLRKKNWKATWHRIKIYEF